MSDYYNYYKSEKRVSGILTLVIVAIIFFVPLFLLNKQAPSTKNVGASSERPFDVITLNVTATSADLFWKSTESSVDTVTVWNDSGKIFTVSDVHDIDSNKQPRKLHYFSLRNLAANTKYYISIGHGEKLLGDSSNPYLSFSTLTTSAITTSLPPIYGKIIDESGKPKSNVFFTASIDEANVLGGFTKTDGSFLISLCCLYNKTNGNPLNPARADMVSLQFENEEGKKAHVSAPISKSSPFQESIYLGRNVTITNDALEEKPVLGSSIQTSSANQDGDVLKIYYPKDSAVIPGKRLLVKGSAIAGNTVRINFPFQKKTFEVEVNGSGVFELATPFELKSGTQTVIASSKDKNGKLLSVSRSFTIPKSGEVVLGEATPSGSLITPTVTSTPMETISPEPTTVLLPTSATTPVPTLLPSGIDFGIFSMMSAMLILFGVGMILLF